MTEHTRILTNTAAATRLRELLGQQTHDPPALDRLLVPTPEDHLLLSGPHDTPLESP